MSEFGDNLTKEFEQTAVKISAKLAEAAKCIQEASALAQEAGLDGLINTEWTEISPEFTERLEENLDEDDDYVYDFVQSLYDMIDVSSLERALDAAGWNTSSSYC